MAKNSVEILIRARDGASKPLEEVRDAVKGVGTEARATLRPLQDYRSELEHHVTELEQVAKGLDKNSSEYRQIVDELARTKTELKGVNDELNNQESALTRVGGQMTSFGAKMSLGVTAPLTAIAGLGIQSAMQLETFSASLEVLIGDTERANAVFEELYEFSANVPFDWRTISEGTRILSAFGIEAEDTVATLSQLGDIAAGTGSDLTGLAEIYGRVAVTGRVSMQEVNSLALRGVPIYQELAAVIGVSTDEVRDLVSNGTIGFAELQQVLSNLTSEGGKFHNMMAAQADTVAGRLARLKDSWEQILDIIGERLLPIFDSLIGHLQSAVDWFVKLDESTQGLFVGLGIALAATGPLLVGIGTLLVQLPRLVAAFRLLRTTMLPLAGPLGILAAAAAGYVALSNAIDAGKEPRRRAQESFEALIDRMASYRSELVITSEAERTAAVEALNRQRRVLEVTIQNQEAFIRSVEADVIAFANKGFFGQLLSFGAANVDLKALEQAEEHLKGLRREFDAIDTSIETISQMVIPNPDSDLPKFTNDVKDLAGAASELVDLGDPTEAVESWLTKFVRSLDNGVQAAKDGWRGLLTQFGVITGTMLRDAFGVDQPENELVTLGKDIVGAIADGIEEAFPSLGARLTAGVTAVKDSLAARALSAHVASGAGLRLPEGGTYTAPTPSPYVPELLGIRPTTRDVAGFERNIEQMSEAMFGSRTAAGRFLADLEAMFARAGREADRAARVDVYTGSQGYQLGQDARFGNDAALNAYHNRMLFDPRSGGPRTLPLPAPYAQVPDAVPIPSAGAYAVTPTPVQLGAPNVTANVTPDRSQLPDETREELLAKEMAARQEVIDGLLSMSTEKGALANFGAQLLSVAADQVPAFGAALNGFVQAGPVGAIVGFFGELLANSIPLQQAFLAINEALAPLGDLLGHIIAPALQFFATVIGWVVDALIAIYNFLLGWLFGPFKKEDYRPPPKEDETTDPPRHSDDPPVGREMSFSSVGPGVQLAVATPLLEAAQLQVTAAQLQITAANSLLTVIGRMESMYSRVLDEGFRVVVEMPSPTTKTTSATAYLR